MDAAALDQLVRRERAEVTNRFLKAAKAARNEREFQTSATQIIQEFAGHAGVDLHLHEEYTLLNGRADAVYNRFIIEYEPPGSLRDKNGYRHNQHAIEQVKGYLTALVRRERHKVERLAGVVFNGDFFIWVRRREKSWYIDDPLPVRPETTERFLRTVCSLSAERALIPENLVEDFGENANVSREAVATLYKALTSPHPRRVAVLFQQWSRQFGEVCDYDQASKLNVCEHARAFGIKEKNVRPFEFFFCLHTYYALLIKLLALQIVHFYLMPKLGTDLRQAAAKPSEELRKYLATVEDGGIFRQLGINNLMEGDFFGWYLDCWSDSIEAACRAVIDTLGNYAADTLDIDPDVSRDLLKNLYQNLMPKQLRHNLGEYYTPDWLAERTLGLLDGAPEETVRQVEGAEKSTRINVYRGDPRKRLLDPACGSGTFLVMAIKRIKQYAWRNTMNERDVLELILQNVVGFDLNPLAVISARTNYLLALGDLLQHRSGEINIPVYLCDSILTPSDDVFIPGDQPTLGLRTGRYSFPTAVGTFTMPASLVTAHSIGVLANLLEESVRVKLSPDQFVRKAADALSLDPERDQGNIKLVTDLYRHLRKLNDEGINGIWARIIKNAFAPIFVGRFDIVAGNPPWINWEHLPEEYRKRITPLWLKYDLFAELSSQDRQKSTRNKADISTLMLAVAVDRYLVPQGKLGFLITQTVFKAEKGARGFRRFHAGRETPYRVVFVDDLVALKPFEGASNRTALLVCHRGRTTHYPIPYMLWTKSERGTSIPNDASITTAIDLTRRSQWIAQPVDSADPLSPWLTGRRRAVLTVSRLVARSAYATDAREGTNTRGANGIYWLRTVAHRPDGKVVVANAADEGRGGFESIETAIEREHVYPLLRGKDVRRWQLSHELNVVIPYTPQTRSNPIDEETLKEESPCTYSFLRHFKESLQKRAAFRNFDPSKNTFYEMYNVGPYSFAPYKVVWREVADGIYAAVASHSTEKRAYIPDHTLVAIPFRRADSAHFVCALLNCAICDYIVRGYIALHPSPHVLKYLPIPEFSEDIALHRQLTAASEAAHEAASRGDTDSIIGLEREIDAQAARLWGLSKAGLDDIQASLADLRGTER